MKKSVANLNGNTNQELIDEYERAIDAAETYVVALSNITVHGRNYQTVENSQLAYQADLSDRVRMVKSVREDIKYLKDCLRDKYRALNEQERSTVRRNRIRKEKAKS